MKRAARVLAMVVGCAALHAAGGFAQQPALAPSVLAARAEYEREHGGACAKRPPPPAPPPASAGGVLYNPEKKTTHPSKGVPAEAAKEIEAQLLAVNGALLACNANAPAYSGHTSVTLDVKTMKWREDQRGLTRCVAAAVGTRLSKTSAAAVPRIVITFQGTLPNVGSLKKEVVRSRIHAGVADVRGCYEAALTGWPELQGRIEARFIIAANGSVSESRVHSSTLGHPNVECCVLNAIDKWTFPEPEGGGIVVITYPFVFEPVAPPP